MLGVFAVLVTSASHNHLLVVEVRGKKVHGEHDNLVTEGRNEMSGRDHTSFFFLSIYLCIKTTRSGHKVSRKTSLGGAQPGVLDDFP